MDKTIRIHGGFCNLVDCSRDHHNRHRHIYMLINCNLRHISHFLPGSDIFQGMLVQILFGMMGDQQEFQ